MATGRVSRGFTTGHLSKLSSFICWAPPSGKQSEVHSGYLTCKHGRVASQPSGGCLPPPQLATVWPPGIFALIAHISLHRNLKSLKVADLQSYTSITNKTTQSWLKLKPWDIISSFIPGGCCDGRRAGNTAQEEGSGLLSHLHLLEPLMHSQCPAQLQCQGCFWRLPQPWISF